MMPYKVVTHVAGEKVAETVITEVTFNPDLPEGWYARPN